MMRTVWCDRLYDSVIEQALQKISEIKQEIGDKKCEFFHRKDFVMAQHFNASCCHNSSTNSTAQSDPGGHKVNTPYLITWQSRDIPLCFVNC